MALKVLKFKFKAQHDPTLVPNGSMIARSVRKAEAQIAVVVFLPLVVRKVLLLEP